VVALRRTEEVVSRSFTMARWPLGILGPSER
jgi:hypothetical protein